MNHVNIFEPGKPLTIGLLVLDAANTLSLAAVVDPLRAANRRAGRDLFHWLWFTADGTPATLTSGLQVPGQALDMRSDLDVIFVIAGFDLEAQSSPDLLRLLRQLSQSGKTIGGVDGGPWIMARAGLLNQHRATTHWEDLETFEIRFPEINVSRDRFVVDGRMITTGGAGSTLDLMLHLIRSRHGEALAMRTAGALIYEPDPTGHRPQTVTSPARLMARAPKVAHAIRIMEENLEEPPSIAQIARQLGMSQRSLETRFQQALNTSPGAYFLNLRLDEARRLASDTTRPVGEIALATGFGSAASFARAFKLAHGQSVTDMRQKA
ncbi:GlxA family transcriptional regulator [Aliiroseovarius sp. KMU-50]|uniref:GlxA family transcriptional regulator n=1 Tax=Aliiroseovarius salicola TaxID=3009082 RepID=A0ABT4W0S4_9RHOB|nr:GlxA family transcriptional regulator [Aliiroseovarius sp. KMU-50]MDA5094106.1 GlxA family transcriptional regulator [Aliiroseovarius sp. KMU-50]